MTNQDPAPPPEQASVGPELNINEDQMRLMSQFITVADQLRESGVDPFAMDEELTYRYLGYLYEAGETEKKGQPAQGFRVAATGVALGAMKSMSPLKVIDAIHTEGMLDGLDANVLGDYVSRLKRVGEQSGFDSPDYVHYVGETIEGINSYVRMNRKDHPASRSLYLMALSTAWAAVRDPSARSGLAERIKTEFSQ